MTNYSKSAVFAIVGHLTIAKPSKMQNIKFYCLITEYFATASPMIWMESQFPELNTMGGYLGFMDTRVQPSGFL